MDITTLGPFGYIYFSGTLMIAASLMVAHWRDLSPQLIAGQDAAPPNPLDKDRHIVTLLGPDGRPNPARYELHDTYAEALGRQRELARHGKGSTVRHADTGTLRFDLSALDCYRRISF